MVKDAQTFKFSINHDKERKSKEFINNKMVKVTQTFKVSINKNKERKSKKFINKMVKDAQTSKVSTYRQEQGQGQEKDEYRVGLKRKNCGFTYTALLVARPLKKHFFYVCLPLTKNIIEIQVDMNIPFE